MEATDFVLRLVIFFRVAVAANGMLKLRNKPWSKSSLA